MPSIDVFFSTYFLLWLQVNLGGGDQQQESWSITFGVVIDFLWRSRNDLVFNQLARQSHVLVCIINNTVVGIVCAKVMESKTACLRAATRVRDHIQWSPTPHGWVKLNCDGARSEGDARASCGGIVRDHASAFCFAFSCNLGECTVLAAELWAILYGVYFAWARGFRSIFIESDSLIAITLLNKGCPRC